LAEQGVKVAINYCRNEVAANDALAKVRGLGSDGFIVQGDVCQPDDIGRMFSRAKLRSMPSVRAGLKTVC
jgi:hypothetical protein